MCLFPYVLSNPQIFSFFLFFFEISDVISCYLWVFSISMLVTASLFTVCSLKEQSWAGRRKGMVFVSLQRNCLGSCQSFFRLFKLGRAPSIGNGCETTTLRNSLWIFVGFFFFYIIWVPSALWVCIWILMHVYGFEMHMHIKSSRIKLTYML